MNCAAWERLFLGWRHSRRLFKDGGRPTNMFSVLQRWLGVRDVTMALLQSSVLTPTGTSAEGLTTFHVWSVATWDSKLSLALC